MVFRIGTADTGGTFDTQGMAIARVFNESRPPEERCELTRSSASIDNANRLDRGENRVRLHGLQLGSTGGTGDGAVWPCHRPADGFSGQRRPDLLRHSGRHARGQHR